MKEECKGLPGKVIPLINRNKCEGKADCVAICPYQVFKMGVLTAEDKQKMSFPGKIKAFVHGNKQAFVVAPDKCHVCNECVKVCPEKAIQLVGKSQIQEG